MSKKTRVDVLLVERGLEQTRQRAQAMIMSGLVFVDGQRVDKAGTAIPNDAQVEVRGNALRYVSRGGLKLEKAFELYGFSLENAVCADIGASTGGFTDCMLQKGASKVFAIDVGYDQLDWKLRNDDRVINMEKCNIRYLDFDTVDRDIDFISIDVSFISLKLVFPVAAKMLADTGSLVCLVKPQFEAGRQQVGKGGIVKDINVHKEVIRNVVQYGIDSGLYSYGLTYSPVKGAKGNIEYLLYMKKEDTDGKVTDDDINRIADSSHRELI